MSSVYFEAAASRGSNVARYNLGIIYQDSNPGSAFTYMQTCANNQFINCYLGLGMMYLHGIGVRKNIDKAIINLQKALDGEHYEAASVLAHIYLTIPEYINKSEAYKQLDYASRADYNMNAKIMLLSHYYENSNKLVSPFVCSKIMKLINDLQFINESEEWYALAHKAFYYHNFSVNKTSDKPIFCKLLFIMCRE
jgi:hypothetical protein